MGFREIERAIRNAEGVIYRIDQSYSNTVGKYDLAEHEARELVPLLRIAIGELEKIRLKEENHP